MQFSGLLNLASKLGVSLPLNLECDDIGTIPPFSELAKGIKSAADAIDSTQTAADGVKFNYPTDVIFNTLF